MKNIPQKLSQKSFKDMLAGNKSYLPSKVQQELKRAGMSDLLSSKHISKQKALTAIKHLQNQGVVSKYKAPSKLYREAGLRQLERTQAQKGMERQKHVRANIAIDIGEELDAESRGEKSYDYDPRSVLGKNLRDEIEETQGSREQKIKAETKRRQRFFNHAPVKKQKPDLVDADNLPDLDIG